ncbi:cupin-like domain-containing protein [Thalassotalea litorea]|uniref:cupin-like domain-containing protein n=1 Tax=Thalassotalea litorea TaxID=2020715 RepID=UPI0037367D12
MIAAKSQSIFNEIKSVDFVDLVDAEKLTSDIWCSDKPIIIKGLVKDWPVVKAGKKSNLALHEYLKKFDRGQVVGAGILEPEQQGRLFYNDDFTGFNFQRCNVSFSEFLTQMQRNRQTKLPRGMYVGSTQVDSLLPGFRDENNLIALDDFDPLMSIWISNQTRIAAHHDVPNNIACCISGKRRFTLFPPEQVQNLYIGPLDFTPAGQAISLVDFYNPDFTAYPRFEQALSHALVAELEPGDALFLPSMWWHHVEGLEDFNILINYWWQTNAPAMGAPIDALYHALLNIKHLPETQKKAWKAMFEHYIFNSDEQALKHIPDDKLGVLNDNDAAMRTIRSMLLHKLNR